MLDKRRKAVTILTAFLGVGVLLGAAWWGFFALKPYALTPEEMSVLYAHGAHDARDTLVHPGAPQRIVVGTTPAWATPLLFTSFDGAPVVGRVVYPTDPRQRADTGGRWPVLIALHAMGRTERRWWEAEFKGRPTVESTHLLAERALKAGYAVVALDARAHGVRKDPVRPLVAHELLLDLHVWGEREPYERLIVETVKDYRVLLDWIERQPQFDASAVRAAGYSMGAQMALLLAAVDPRVRSVAAMVPPHVDAKVAAVSPLTVTPQLAEVEVWLLTANDDGHAAAADNAALFAALPGAPKRHLTFDGGHVLPATYVDRLQPWLRAPAP